MKLSPSDQRLLLACFMPCRGCKLECRYYHRRVFDKGKCSLCNHSVKQHIPENAQEQAALLSRLLNCMDHRLGFPACHYDKNTITSQMFCDLLIGAVTVSTYCSHASIKHWVFVEECIDQDVAHQFRDALVSSSGVSTPFTGLSRRLKRELDCRDSLLYWPNGGVYAELIANFMLNRVPILSAVDTVARYGEYDAMRQLLRKGVNIQMSTFYHTLNEDRAKILELLLHNCIVPDKTLLAIMHLAIAADAVNIVDSILCRHVNTREVTLDMFEEGCRLGSHRTIEFLLKKIPEIKRSWQLSNALAHAISWGHLKIVQLIIDYVPQTHYSHLMRTACVMSRAPDIVSLLLARGARCQINCCTSVRIANLLLAADIDINGGLTFAAQCDNEEMAQLLLDNNAPVNAATTRGQTALHYAAYYGAMDVMRLLLFADADVNFKDVEGCTPLALAYQNRKYSAARILIWAGAQL